MGEMTMKNKILITLVAVAVAVAFMPASASAASKVKMTAYDKVYKSGNTVYCAGEGSSIYKVKVKKGVVTSKKKIMNGNWAMADYSYISTMKKKGKYLYYVHSSEGTYWAVYRINVKGGKEKMVASSAYEYAIKGKRIYAEFYNPYNEEKPKYKSMKLNGKNKKKTSKRPKVKHKKTNAKGYSVTYKMSDDCVKTYLKTPKGKFYLGETALY